MHTTAFLIQWSWAMITLCCCVLCVHTHNQRKGHCKWSHNSWVGGVKHLVSFEVAKKRWGHTLFSVKCCYFVRKSSWESHEPVWKEKEQELIWSFITFWFSSFVMMFCTTRRLVDHGNTRRWIVHCHKGL